MKKFAALFDKIDQVQSTNEKVLHIKNYFSTCTDEDGAWTLFFLCGHRIKRLISSRMLLEWSISLINLPLWLIEEAKSSVGDTAETISLLLPRKETVEISNDRSLYQSYPQSLNFDSSRQSQIEALRSERQSPSPSGKGEKEDQFGKVVASQNSKFEGNFGIAEWMETIIKPLKDVSLEEKKDKIISIWKGLSSKEIFILNKILTGSFRMGISTLLTLKALSQAIDVKREILSQRLMGNWTPTALFFKSLKSSEFDNKLLNPYPFYLAHPFEGDLNSLGPLSDWQIEWKWDGIRGQAVIGEEGVALWSRGNELISDQFPDLIEAFKKIAPRTILDGEILAYANDHPLPFAELQKRLGRKDVSKSMQEKVPIVFIVYDILEYNGVDVRNKPMHERRAILQSLTLHPQKMILSQLVKGIDWQHISNLRLQSREKGVEGLMLKKMDSLYGVGRQKGYWWKYKVDPMTIDAVLIYAQAGTGRRANLFTDYTFGVWHKGELVPIAKAYSGLDQKEINELDRWIRKNTDEKFGPVRKVKALHLFEIGFEGIQKSNRHKSGVALRFPRILRWRKDKPIEECDHLESIKQNFLREEK